MQILAKSFKPETSDCDKVDSPVMGDATFLLSAIQTGNSKAAEDLLKLVYDELRRLAAFKMSQQPPGHTLQPTALVHEAWLKLVGTEKTPNFQNRAHFFAAAAAAMRHILIDRSRRKLTQRHGGGFERIGLEEFELVSPVPDEQFLDMNDALDRFSQQYPVQAEVVKLRYFVGITNEQVAELLGISVSTVKNYWNFARAWLFKEINRG